MALKTQSTGSELERSTPSTKLCEERHSATPQGVAGEECSRWLHAVMIHHAIQHGNYYSDEGFTIW
jgi:hypothetical protein